MLKINLLELCQVETGLQKIELLISSLNHTQLKYEYLQKVSSMRKELIQTLLLDYDTRTPTTRFTLSQLQQNYNGKNNQPAYVAIDNIVYDVTYEAAWGGGNHFGMQAGEDMSNVITKCHSQNKDDIIRKLIPVGILES
ncbi:MAG: cytochrome b5 domain-containing protein [Cellulosilyticaceae bacterium]